MMGLAGHGLGDLGSERSFGHSGGYAANVVGLIDPERRLTIGLVLNGLLLSSDELRVSRAPIIDAVFEAADERSKQATR